MGGGVDGPHDLLPLARTALGNRAEVVTDGEVQGSVRAQSVQHPPLVGGQVDLLPLLTDLVGVELSAQLLALEGRLDHAEGFTHPAPQGAAGGLELVAIARRQVGQGNHPRLGEVDRPEGRGETQHRQVAELHRPPHQQGVLVAGKGQVLSRQQFVVQRPRILRVRLAGLAHFIQLAHGLLEIADVHHAG